VLLKHFEPERRERWSTPVLNKRYVEYGRFASRPNFTDYIL
jgi:hypothetical protein